MDVSLDNIFRYILNIYSILDTFIAVQLYISW